MLIQVLSKTMDSTTLSPDKIELSTVKRDEENDQVSLWSCITCCYSGILTPALCLLHTHNTGITPRCCCCEVTTPLLVSDPYNDSCGLKATVAGFVGARDERVHSTALSIHEMLQTTMTYYCRVCSHQLNQLG